MRSAVDLTNPMAGQSTRMYNREQKKGGVVSNSQKWGMGFTTITQRDHCGTRPFEEWKKLNRRLVYLIYRFWMGFLNGGVPWCDATLTATG